MIRKKGPSGCQLCISPEFKFTVITTANKIKSKFGSTWAVYYWKLITQIRLIRSLAPLGRFTIAN